MFETITRFKSISGPATLPSNQNQFIDIDGLSIELPEGSLTKHYALIILNVPRPYAEGNDFPGLDFCIHTGGEKPAAEGGFTYPMKQPQSFQRMPFTLVVRVDLNEHEHTHVRAQWKSVRGSVGHIDSFASLSAIID